MTLWKITGEASNDSGGGYMAVYAIADDDITPPDPRKALEEANPRYGWYRIDEIRPVGDFPAAWDWSGNSPMDGVAEAIEQAGRKKEERMTRRSRALVG